MRVVPFLLLLLVAASGVVPATAEPYVATDRASYTYAGGAGLERVTITFHNPTSSTVYLLNSAPFVIEDEEGIVFRPGGTQGILHVEPGEAYAVTWNMRTTCLALAEPAAFRPNCAGLALPGTYTVTWDYLPTPTTSATVTTTFTIEAF